MKGKAYKDRIAEELTRRVNPTHFVTLSLIQSRSIASGKAEAWAKGDDVIYQAAYDGFVRSLSKRSVSPRVWKRHKPILPSYGSIEGDGSNTLHHLHLAISKPSCWTEFEWENALRLTALGNPWIKNGSYAVHIEKLPDSAAKFRAGRYILKGGADRLCLTGTFQGAATSH